MQPNLVVLYKAKDFPIFQNKVFSSKTEARNCARGDITLVQDLKTGLVYNLTFQAELMQYDTNYQNEQSHSNAFRKHFTKVIEIVNRHFSGMSLLEIGCGKGYFLRLLQNQGYSVLGLDPAYEGKNPYVICSYYTSKLGVKAGGIIMRHVLEHVTNPFSFLSEVFSGNNMQGKIYIEVPCFEWIIKHKAWFDIYYEHVNYFRISDFYRIFGRIYESGHLFGGQYLYVVADLSTLRPPIMESKEIISFPSDFLASIEKWSARIKENNSKRKHTVIWGGASKGIIFCLLMERAGAKIDLIIDINPEKQGKYTPITAKKIFSPDKAMAILQPNTDIFIMNSNYTEEIRAFTENRFNYVEIDYGEN